MNFMKRLPVVGYENSYEVTEDGRVFAVARIVQGTDGTIYPFKAKEKSVNPNVRVQYPQVNLWKNNQSKWVYVHRLVAEAFIPNPDNLPEVNHIDGNRLNNHVSNLEWTSRSGNMQHSWDTGLRKNAINKRKQDWEDWMWRVIDGESYAQLSTDTPYKVPFLSTTIRKLARQQNVEHLLNESLQQQKIERARKNGAKNKSATK